MDREYNHYELLIKQHLEHYFGQIDEQIEVDDPELFVNRAIGFYKHTIAHTRTWITLGLSSKVLESGVSSIPDLRYELIITGWDRFSSSRMQELLLSVANDLARINRAPVEGRVIDLGESLVNGGACEGFIFYEPVFFPPEIALLESDDLTVAFMWLCPVTRREIDFIDSYGWEMFESTLMSQEPDPFDLGRASINLLN